MLDAQTNMPSAQAKAYATHGCATSGSHRNAQAPANTTPSARYTSPEGDASPTRQRQVAVATPTAQYQQRHPTRARSPASGGEPPTWSYTRFPESISVADAHRPPQGATSARGWVKQERSEHDSSAQRQSSGDRARIAADNLIAKLKSDNEQLAFLITNQDGLL